MMIPIQGNGSPLKSGSGSAPDEVQAGLTGDSEGLSFSQTLLELAETNPNGAALLLALQQSAVLPELPVSLPASGSLLPSGGGTGGNPLPPAQLQASQLMHLQGMPLQEQIQTIDPRQLQQLLLGEKTTPQGNQLSAMVANSRFAADDLLSMEGRGLADFTQQLQGLGLHAAGGQTASGVRPMIALPLQVPVGQPGWDNAVGERIQWMLSRNVQQAEIKLSPPQLGPMEIKISLQNDQTSVQFMASHSATRDALEAAIPRLRELFGEINLNLANVDVSQRQAGDTAAQGDSSANGSSRESGFADTGQDTAQETQAAAVRLQSWGLLDIYA